MVYVFPIEREPQKAIIAGAVVFSLLPTAAVVLRMVARSRLKSFSLDLSDWLIVVACVSFLPARVFLYHYGKPLTKFNSSGCRRCVPSTRSHLRRGWWDGIPHD